MVERHLPMVNVVGSSPISRLFFLKIIVHFIDICQFYIINVQDSLQTLVVGEFLFFDVNLSDSLALAEPLPCLRQA